MCIFILKIGEALRLEEILAVASKFNVCPKCDSREGFWLELTLSTAKAGGSRFFRGKRF